MDTDETKCNQGAGCNNAAGFYCDRLYWKCHPCSPCRDPYSGSVRVLYVVRACLRNGFCPRLCQVHTLGNSPPANETFCEREDFQQVPDCNLSCQNGGTLDSGLCQCTCSEGWGGLDCSDCNLLCQNGGTLDSGLCQCTCSEGWGGKNCSECQLSCQNGGRLDNTSCQCFCNQYWTGNTCSECELVCENLGTLDTTLCQCLCNDDWKGLTCADLHEPVPVSNKPDGKEDTQWYTYTLWISIAVVVILCGFFVVSVCRKKMKCTNKFPRSDVERPILEYEMKVSDATPTSLAIEVEAQNHRHKRKKIKLSCYKKSDGGPSTQEMFLGILSQSPNHIARHTFSNLEPGTAYTIKLHVMDSKWWREAKTLQESTKYQSLRVVVDVSGRSATVCDLQHLQYNALAVCSCLVQNVDQRWIDIPPGADEVRLTSIQPGLVYTVQAGVVPSYLFTPMQDIGKALQHFVAKGTFEVPGDVSQMGEDCMTMIGYVFGDISLSRSLGIEISGRNMATLIAYSCGLEGDDLRQVVNAGDQRKLEVLSDILESYRGRGQAIPIHEVMEKLTEFPEAENFVWKLAKISGFRCSACMRLLHKLHSAMSPLAPASSSDPAQVTA